MNKKGQFALWTFGICLIVFVFFFTCILDNNNENDGQNAPSYNITSYECVKSNLEEFNKCIDIGREKCGFLCSNHYWLCDEIKVKYKCLEWKKVVSEIKKENIGR